MRVPVTRWIGLALLVGVCGSGSRSAWAGDAGPGGAVGGDTLDPSTYGNSFVESFEAVRARQQALLDNADRSTAPGKHIGHWVVPKMRAARFPHSGVRYVTNTWGATRMGVRFPRRANVEGAFFGGQSGVGVWAAAVRAVGYRDDHKVGTTAWLQIQGQPAWLAMDFQDVDRVVIESQPRFHGGGWFSLDDLAYRFVDTPDQRIEVDFESAAFGQDLTRTGFAGLTWEVGEGGYINNEADDGVPAPHGGGPESPAEAPGDTGGPEGGAGTLPQLGLNFRGVIRGDAGQGSFPPDTCGAVGTNHFVVVVNRVFAVYNKSNGTLVPGSMVSLGAFQPGSSGDPRVLFDQFTNRWVVVSSDFGTRIFLAYSQTDNPTGNWFKTSFVASQGTDATCFPDYPTLGVDQNGIYVTSFMAAGSGSDCGMTIFAIDKAPLLPLTPSLGTVTAFRGQPFEGAIQPAHTFGTPSGEFLISRQSATQLRVRRVNPPLTAPTLNTLTSVTIPNHTTPPDAPAMGAGTPLDTVDHRLMNAVYRDGSIWTAHAVSVGGRSAARWYQVNMTSFALTQSGTVDDPVRHYFFPTIMVNSHGDAVMAFSGSSPTEFASAYYTGRVVSDPAGQMAPAALVHAGVASQNLIDSFGRNRFGDYSLTSLDPTNATTVWTIQEYTHATDVWGTWVARTIPFIDCNTNGINDPDEITGGTAVDCNTDQVPDECQTNPVLCGGNCLPDCNTNQIIDSCDVFDGTSPDCDGNQVPDECQTDCNSNGVPDRCDTDPPLCAPNCLPDCNGNFKPDECEVNPVFCGGACQPDCDSDGIMDQCELFSGSQDCDSNLVPDECEPDCNGNMVADACELVPVFSTQASFSPFDSTAPQTLTVVHPPVASGTVTITFRAISDLGSFLELCDVTLNNTPIGQVYGPGGNDCPAAPDVESLMLTDAAFNGLVNGGNAAIRIAPNAAVDPVCLNSSVTIQLSYATPDRDCDNNGQLDVCDTGIFINVLLGFDANPAHLCVADRNQDGLANGADVQVFVGERLGM
ncbi:MAG: hypothetical protein U1A27_13925 [Phycisphaerae bacterium]